MSGTFSVLPDKGKGLASYQKDERAIGEDGKPLEKQIVLSERYDKENPGLVGGVTGILETFGTAAASWAVKEGLSKLWEFGKNMIMGKKESAEEKLDRLFMSYYETGLDHLKNATMTQNDQRREGSVHNAANSFIAAANLIQTGCFVKAKSMLSVAGCHHLIREYDVAKHWLEKAYEEGRAECRRSHTRYELEQFKSEIMVPLDKLLQSYPPTSNSTVPQLSQFREFEIGSSSTPDMKTLQDENKTLRSENQRVMRLLDQALQEKQDANKKIQELEKTIRDLTACLNQDTTDRSFLRHPERLTEIYTLTGHNACVNSLVVHEMCLISGSADKTIKVWDINKGSYINTIMGYDSGVNSLVVHDRYLISGRYDKTIKVWDINTGGCINTIMGHNYSVKLLVSYDRYMIRGRYDKKIKVWGVK